MRVAKSAVNSRTQSRTFLEWLQARYLFVWQLLKQNGQLFLKSMANRKWKIINTVMYDVRSERFRGWYEGVFFVFGTAVVLRSPARKVAQILTRTHT